MSHLTGSPAIDSDNLNSEEGEDYVSLASREWEQWVEVWIEVMLVMEEMGRLQGEAGEGCSCLTVVVVKLRWSDAG